MELTLGRGQRAGSALRTTIRVLLLTLAACLSVLVFWLVSLSPGDYSALGAKSVYAAAPALGAPVAQNRAAPILDNAPAQRQQVSPTGCLGQWDVVPSPNAPDTDFLEGVAATSANDVWAVGLIYAPPSGYQRTLTEHWDGTQWSIVPSANQGGDNNVLNAVTSVSANDVWAVGYWQPGGTAPKSLAEHWDGTQWSILPTPDLGAAASYLFLSATAVASNNVWAVGYVTQDRVTYRVLVEHWDGAQWSFVLTPGISGSNTDYLFGVDALSANDMWAVGYYQGSSGLSHTLTEHWNGIQWSVVPSPDASTAGNTLAGVSVLSSNDAWAVGYQGPGRSGSDQTLTEHWDGAQWSVVPGPNPAAGAALLSVAAVSAGDVWAVGTLFSAPSMTVIEHWNGSAWAVVTNSDPPDTTRSELAGVAALSSNDLWAVGDYSTSLDPSGQTLMKHYTSTCPTNTPGSTQTGTPSATGTSTNTPSLTPTHTPPSTATPAATQTPSATPTVCGVQWVQVASANPTADQITLNDIGASGSADIWTVGSYYTSGSPTKPLAMHWDGAAWSIVSNPLSEGSLSGVSVLSTGDAWAVGSTGNQTLLEHWDGAQWSVVPGPSPVGTSTLNRVTAISHDNAWAVGSVSNGGTSGLITHWDGTQWTVIQNPSPPMSQLFGVYAVSLQDVWAVGEYRLSSAGNPYKALTMHWDGTNWNVVNNPAGDESHLYAVGGDSSSDVWAVGAATFGDTTLTMHWNGTSWTIVPSPNLGNLVNMFSGVVALSPGDAWAVGYSNSSSGTLRALIAHWDGTAWTLVAHPDPAGGNRLSGITALSSQDIWAVGSAGCAGCLTTTLVERYYDPCVTPVATMTPASTRTATRTPGRTPSATPTACAIAFSDVQTTDYFYQAVAYLYCHGAISGYADGTFRPYNNTTRGQLSKIVALAEGWAIDTTGGPHFTDVPSSNPFYTYIETAYNHSVISGYADGTFRWGNNVTRAQLSKIVVLSEQWAIDTTGGPHFSDVPVAHPFYTYIETAYNHSIISGYADGTFRPGNNATRGQISKIVYNAVTGP